jgi:CRP-like cAMP-binding protein
LIRQASLSNRLLKALSVRDFQLLEPHLVAIQLDLGHSIAVANEPIEHVYFLETGIASVVANRADGRSIEVGIYGRDGMGGTPLLLGSDRTPHDHYMQVAGEGHRIERAAFLGAIQQSASLNGLLIRFVHAFTTQTAQTALANGSSRIEERLARWLLMCGDRIDGDEISITHRFLAMMLCVRRSGVTDAIHILEGQGLIRAKRSNIAIKDRAGLEHLAGASYGLPEAEYQRLIGPL